MQTEQTQNSFPESNPQVLVPSEPVESTTESLKPVQKVKSTFRGPWIDALLAPNEAQITKIKENNRGRLVKENYEYFSFSITDIDTAVGRLLDKGELISRCIVLTSAEDETKGDITDFVLKGYCHIVKDIFEPESGTGLISHLHYFDAEYTTDLRATECYKVLYTLDSILEIIEKVRNLTFSKLGFVNALTNYLVTSNSSMESIKKIEKQLIDNWIIDEEHIFSANVIKAQAKAEKVNNSSSVSTKEEKQAFEIMKDYAMLNNQGKAQIINTTKLGLVASSESGLKSLFKNQLIDGVNPVDIWMQSTNRPLYIDTKFDPSCNTKDNAYNLFKGFAHPAQKLIDIVMFKNFVKDVICSGDDKMYNIVWSFLAQMLQDPTRKMGTALVLLSSKGAGKSVFVKVIGELLKGYFYQSADNKRLLGEFNNHLASTLLFYANELTFTDNKKVISKLKNVITEKNFTYEIKGGATYSADNYIRVIIDSNDDMAVVQTADERRFIYPVISEARIGDTEYFNDLHSLFEMEGFYESLMHELMNYDYTPWEHYLKTPPKNEVTQEQVMESFTAIESWWLNCLEEGHIPYVDYEVTYDGKLNITNEAMYLSFVKYTRINGDRVNLNSAMFGKAFKKHILKDLDLDIKSKIKVGRDRKNSRIYETRDKNVKHFASIKHLNNIAYDGGDWEESVI